MGEVRDPRNFSLPTQRCFSHEVIELAKKRLFSAYAEVFPEVISSPWQSATFLCLRRGVSWRGSSVVHAVVFSLPTQRCFHQLSQCDEDLLTFLCLRRGVSTYFFLLQCYKFFSLPTQRCFSRILLLKAEQCLFSAYAEVFPPPRHPPGSQQTFLCLRRGVSES